MALFGKRKTEFNTAAVIVAAGMSTRMSCCENKQLLELNGHPLLAYTLNAFQKAQTVNSIIVVASEKLIPIASRIASDYGITKITKIVQGGDSRQKSVVCGINALPDDVEFVAIHDGARPFVSPELIDRVNKCAYEYKAAAPGIRVTSTVKVVDKNSFIKKTVDRDPLRLIQTPQTFDCPKYKSLLFAAMSDGRDYTDDCQIFESKNHKIALLEGEQSNIKLTCDADVPYAQLIASGIKLQEE